MEALHTVLVILHFVGLATIVVGAIAALIVNRGWALQALVWGARAQVLTGITLAAMKLAGVGEEEDEQANVAKLAVKLIVALAVAGLAESAVRRRKRPLVAAALVLTLVNAAIASMWH